MVPSSRTHPAQASPLWRSRGSGKGGRGLHRGADGAGIGNIGGPVLLIDRGETLFWEGDPGRSLYRLLRGGMRAVSNLEDGTRTVLDFIFPGGFVGFAPDGVRRYSAEAMNSCALERLNGDGGQEDLLAAACYELERTRLRAFLLGLRSADRRVCELLARLPAKPLHDGSLDVALPMPRADFADYLAMTQETVSRVFAHLKEKGQIVVHDLHRVAIRDPARFLASSRQSGA